MLELVRAAYDRVALVESLKVLFPYSDGDLLSRTRIQWEELATILLLLVKDIGTDGIACLLDNTGGVGLQAFAGLALCLGMNVEARPYIFGLLNHGVYCVGLKLPVKVNKACHNILRRTGSIPYFMRKVRVPALTILDPSIHNKPLNELQIPRQFIMYCDQLGGRAQDNLLGFDGYVEKRAVTPSPYGLKMRESESLRQTMAWLRAAEPVYKRLHDVASAAFASHHHYTPEEFKASFIKVAPLGSLGSSKHDLHEFLDDLHNAHKRLWLDSQPIEQLWEVLELEPYMLHDAQVKTEPGPKLRQIIPGQPPQWSVEAQIMHFLEIQFYESNSTLTLGSSRWRVFCDHQERRLRKARGLGTIATDYDDFNWAHLRYLMQRVYAKIGEAAQSQSGKGDWNGLNYAGHIHKCCEWMVANIDRMYVREVGGDGMYHMVFQGLSSGWGTTSFINNFMNDLHDSIHQDEIEHIAGHKPLGKIRKNGDDGDAAFRVLLCALLYIRSMTLTGMQMQPGKQLIGDVNEFLRILGIGDELWGCINRGIGSFVSSDLQAPVRDNGLAYTTGSCEALQMLVRRGASPQFCANLQTPLLLHFASVKTQRPDGSERIVHLTNVDALYAKCSDGGFGAYYYGQHTYNKLPHARAWPVIRAPWSLEGAPHHGVHAAMKLVFNRFNEAGITCDRYSALHTDFIDAATQNVDTYRHAAAENIARNAYADHIEWLNNLGKVRNSTTPYAEVIEANVAKVATGRFRFFMDSSPEDIADFDLPDVEHEVDRAIGRALGLGSITPAILHDLRDSKTLERLTVRQVLSRVHARDAAIGRMNSILPEQVVNAILEAGYRLPSFYAATVPADYLPVAKAATMLTIRDCYKSQDTPARVMQHCDGIAHSAQAVITDLMLTVYKNKINI